MTIDEIPIAEQFTLRFIMIKRDLDSLSGRLSHIPHGYGPWELVLRLRSSHQDVHLICVLSHPDFEKRWDAEWQER